MSRNYFSTSLLYALTVYANAIYRDARFNYKTCAVRVIGFVVFGGVSHVRETTYGVGCS